MAQASSAQREPSMEEILASIRRIIEDNETGRGDDGATARDKASDAEGTDQVRSELRQSLQIQPSRHEQEVASPSLGRPETPVSVQPASQPLDSDDPDLTDEEDEDDSPIPVAANAPTAAPPHARDAAISWGATVELPAAHPPRIEPERRGILSEISGRKVAAAFEELNEALLANRRKTLDQMAEEMLRPMLQEWLDNNLPQMVERLVREEIERIARGV